LRILVISHLPEVKFSSRLHLGFLRGLEGFCGYGFLNGNDVIRDGMTSRDIEDKYDPDAVILYDSCAPKGGYERFSDTFFKSFRCAKVVVEVDFWKKIHRNRLDFYVKNEFDLIIRRGPFGGMKTIEGIPSVWLPFSISPEFMDDGHDRRDVIGFAGAFKPKIDLPNGTQCYYQRRRSMKLLKDAGILEHFVKGRTLEGSKRYPDFLRSVFAVLSSAELKVPYAKTFEIMGSGAVLLTPDFQHKESLFGFDELFVTYKDDCSDVVEKAKKILNEKDWAKAMAKRAYSVVQTLHTHEKRIMELFWHLYRLLNGYPVLHVWE
jgi:hypothetical protein